MFQLCCPENFVIFVFVLIVRVNLNSSHTQVNENVLASYRNRVKAMFYHSYNGYLNHAYPLDELRPITCDGQDTWGSYSLTLVDALDTLAVMGNKTEFQRVVGLLLERLDFDRDINVSVFETNIRVVGGLISAHLFYYKMGMDLEQGWPCSGPLLRLAENVARRLLPAFNTSTGMPYGTVNLKYGVPKDETPVTCTAGVGTFMVEFGALSRLTGDPIFEETALRAMRALWSARSSIGLVGNHIDVQTGKWTALDSGIGAGVDSYFEYLVKGATLFHYPEFMEMFYDYEEKIEKYLKREDWFMWGHMTKGTITLPIFQSLEAFWPGMQSMVGNIDKAMKTLHNYHQVWKQYGFTPEFYNIPKGEAQANRDGYPLRPELIESTVYLYQATKDPYLIQVGIDIVEAIDHSCKTKCGYASVKSVLDHKLDNRMESFFLAETTKYLYLLFDENNFIHNSGGYGTVINTTNGECVIDAGGYIFNTEAHPVDAAALYCCSAKKKEHDKVLQDFHDNVDLLALLDIVEPNNDSFTIDTKEEKHDNLINFPKKKPYEPNLEGKAVDLQVDQSTLESIISVLSEDNKKSTLTFDDIQKNSESGFESSFSDMEKKLEKLIKVSGNYELHVDQAVEKIISSIKEIGGMRENAQKWISDDSHELRSPKTTLKDLFLRFRNIIEKEKDTCLKNEKFQEEQKELLNKINIRVNNTAIGSYVQNLFTCPVQPFYSRFSLMGEMFVKN